MARTRGSGYKSQLYILLVLEKFGALYGQEAVEKTGLKREEVWRNLKVLFDVRAIGREKVGRRAYYKIRLSKDSFDIITWVLNEGGPRQLKEKTSKVILGITKNQKAMGSMVKDAKEYDEEIAELVAFGEDPYLNLLKFVDERRKTKQELANIGSKSAFELPSTRIRQKTELAKTPKKLATKEIQLANGQKFIVRKMTLYELEDALKPIKSKKSENNTSIIEAASILSKLLSYNNS